MEINAIAGNIFCLLWFLLMVLLLLPTLVAVFVGIGRQVEKWMKENQENEQEIPRRESIQRFFVERQPKEDAIEFFGSMWSSQLEENEVLEIVMKHICQNPNSREDMVSLQLAMKINDDLESKVLKKS